MAQLKLEQLTAHLSQQFSPLYIVSGDETLLVQEAADAIREKAKQEGFENRELYHVETNFDWDILHYASQSLGLFSEKKFIELRISGKLNDKGRKALVEYSQQPPEETLLLLILPKLERAQLSSKWFSSLEKAGQFIQIWPINANNLPRWIDQRAKKMGLQIASDAVATLATRVEGNLLAASQELEKLRLLNIEGQISAEILSQSVSDSSRYDVFKLTDSALKGDGINALKMLQGLRSEGAEVIGILWALTRDIRLLHRLRKETDNGKQFATAAKSLGIWQNRQGIVQSALRRTKPNQLLLLLRLAAQCDRAAKGMDCADPWQLCTDILLVLAGQTPFTNSTYRTALRL